MSKSRSSSEDSFVLNLERSSETTGSSFGTSDLSFGSTLSEKADNIIIILGSFIPEELIPSHEVIEEVISNLDSVRSSILSVDIEELGHIAEVLTEVNIQTDKKQDHSLSISDSKLSSKNNVAFFRSVIDDLQLGGFFYGIEDKEIKKEYDILFEVIEEQNPRAISLRPELTKMDKGQLKRSQKEAEIDHDIVRVVRPKVAKKTKAEINKEEAKERSDLKAISIYERNCVGGISFISNEYGSLIVNSDSIIDRPTNITGNLGRVAGNHVVSLSMITKNLQSIIRGKEIYEAIKGVRDFAAGITEVGIFEGEYRDQNSFQSIIDKAAIYESRAERPLAPPKCIFIEDHNASNFLRSELIPSVIRSWNMQTRAAFLGKKTKPELGKEGNKVKNVLKDLLKTSKKDDSDIEDIAYSFISAIDYSPVGIDDNRGNDVQQLALIIGSVIDVNHLINSEDTFYDEAGLDNQSIGNITSAEDIFNQMLEEHGWIEYYKNNPQDLDPALKIEDNISLGVEYIKKVIMDKMLEEYPHLIDELDYSTQSRKEELERDNYLVKNVARDGNCFFHAVALQTGRAHEELRAIAINEVNLNRFRYENFVPRGDIDLYIARMRQNREWADNIMIQAVANSLNQDIEVFNINGRANMIINVDSSIRINSQPTTIRVLYTGNHYMSVTEYNAEIDISRSRNRNRADEDSLASLHLVGSEKRVLSEVKEERQFINLLTKDLTLEEREILHEIQDKPNTSSSPIILDSVLSSVSNPFVTLIPEENHQIEHKQNIFHLSKMLEDGLIRPNTVICLERKEEGNNFGMKDVKLLASILRYNNNNELPIPISNDIKSLPIYQDAILYNKSLVRGVEIIGIEGKSLQHGKNSPNYNQSRELYMADRINQLTSSGKNVILPIGSSHISGLKKQLEGRVILSNKTKVKIDSKDLVVNMKETLQESYESSFVQTVSASQNKKDTQQIR